MGGFPDLDVGTWMNRGRISAEWSVSPEIASEAVPHSTSFELATV